MALGFRVQGFGFRVEGSLVCSSVDVRNAMLAEASIWASCLRVARCVPR